MSKVILVIDEPVKGCGMCRLCQYDNEGHRICSAEDTSDHGNHTSVYDYWYNNTKPSWCQLKPMPEKKILMKFQGRENKEYEGLVRGYNKCIDEILGEEDDR